MAPASHVASAFGAAVMASVLVGCGQGATAAPPAAPQATLAPTPQRVVPAGAQPAFTPSAGAGAGRRETTVICFERISFPEDEEGLRTQIGPMAGIISLIVEPDDTMTVSFDPAVLAREEIVLRARSLGFSALSDPCR